MKYAAPLFHQYYTLNSDSPKPQKIINKIYELKIRKWNIIL